MAWVCSIVPLASDSSRGIATANWNKGFDDALEYSRLCTLSDEDVAAFTAEAQAAYDAAVVQRDARQQFADSVVANLNQNYADRLVVEAAQQVARTPVALPPIQIKGSKLND